MKAKYLPLLVISFLIACSNVSDYDQDLVNKLDENTAVIDIKIDGKNFYTEKSIFIPTTTIAEKYIAINLVDQYGGNTQIQLSRSNWVSDIKAPFLISPSTLPGYTDYGTFLIGKRDASTMEGFILSRGKFNWLKLTSDEAVLQCEGFLVKPQDAFIEENEIPFNGIIYLKNPTIEFKDISKEQIFK